MSLGSPVTLVFQPNRRYRIRTETTLNDVLYAGGGLKNYDSEPLYFANDARWVHS